MTDLFHILALTSGILPLVAYTIQFQMHFLVIRQVGKVLDQHICYQMEGLKELVEQKRPITTWKLILFQAVE
jgi:hypothetical protein